MDRTVPSELQMIKLYTENLRQNYHLSQTLGYRNGYAMKNQPMHPIGGGRIGTGFRKYYR